MEYLTMKSKTSISIIKIIFFTLLVLYIITITWGNSITQKGMKELLKKYEGNYLIQNYENCIIFADEKEAKEHINITLVIINSYDFSNQENKISYNSESAYITDYKQSNYLYFIKNLKISSVLTAPAKANDGYITWFDSVSLLPSFTVIEMKFQKEYIPDVENITIENLDLKYERMKN